MRVVVTLLAALIGAAFTVFLGIRAIDWGKRKYDAFEAGRTRDPVTQTYERLYRAQFTAADPYAAQQPILCEGRRLIYALGFDSAGRTIRRAQRRVLATIDTRDRRRVDSALANKLIGGGAACEELAREGVLGGPWPSDSAREAHNRREWELTHPE